MRLILVKRIALAAELDAMIFREHSYIYYEFQRKYI